MLIDISVLDEWIFPIVCLFDVLLFVHEKHICLVYINQLCVQNESIVMCSCKLRFYFKHFIVWEWRLVSSNYCCTKSLLNYYIKCHT